MGLKKGNTNNPNGRPKGSKNQVTQDLRERIGNFIGEELDNVIRDFKQLPLPERMRFFERLLGYTLPRLQSIEYASPTDQLIERLSNEELDRLINEVIKRHENV